MPLKIPSPHVDAENIVKNGKSTARTNFFQVHEFPGTAKVGSMARSIMDKQEEIPASPGKVLENVPEMFDDIYALRHHAINTWMHHDKELDVPEAMLDMNVLMRMYSFRRWQEMDDAAMQEVNVLASMFDMDRDAMARIYARAMRGKFWLVNPEIQELVVNYLATRYRHPDKDHDLPALSAMVDIIHSSNAGDIIKKFFAVENETIASAVTRHVMNDRVKEEITVTDLEFYWNNKNRFLREAFMQKYIDGRYDSRHSHAMSCEALEYVRQDLGEKRPPEKNRRDFRAMVNAEFNGKCKRRGY
jgi:hypothetical protein